ncbi:MAG: hypothetical protein ACREYC_12045 [Gammaproteobacteria bacterium]
MANAKLIGGPPKHFALPPLFYSNIQSDDKPMNVMPRLCLILALLCFAACSTGEDKTDQPAEHVWKEQTDAIKKAKEINRIIESQAEKQRQAIENQSR